MSCPHQRIAADVRIRGNGESPREGTLTVKCQDCGADFGFIGQASPAGDVLQFRVVPINRPQILSVPQNPTLLSPTQAIRSA